MMQIKKKFLSLLLLFGICFLFPNNAMAQESISWNQSDVADQKSVIEEQVERGITASQYSMVINSLTKQ